MDTFTKTIWYGIFTLSKSLLNNPVDLYDIGKVTCTMHRKCKEMLGKDMVRPCNISGHHCIHPMLHEPHVQITSMPVISNISTLVALFRTESLTLANTPRNEDARKTCQTCINTCILSSQSKVEHRHKQDPKNRMLSSSHLQRLSSSFIFDALLLNTLKASQGYVSSGSLPGAVDLLVYVQEPTGSYGWICQVLQSNIRLHQVAVVPTNVVKFYPVFVICNLLDPKGFAFTNWWSFLYSAPLIALLCFLQRHSLPILKQLLVVDLVQVDGRWTQIPRLGGRIFILSKDLSIFGRVGSLVHNLMRLVSVTWAERWVTHLLPAWPLQNVSFTATFGLPVSLLCGVQEGKEGTKLPVPSTTFWATSQDFFFDMSHHFISAGILNNTFAKFT